MVKDKKKIIKEYFMIALGTLIMSAGVYYFLVADNLVSGGVSGLAIVIHSLIPLPVSAITFMLNAVLLIIGFIFLGKEFGVKTIYSTVLFSFYLYLMETYTPGPNDGISLTGMIWLDIIMGIVISCYGQCIVFNQDASTGGTDIVARLFNKYFNLPLGTGLLLADVLVVAGGMWVFEFKIALVGIFGWFLTGITTNYFIDGFNVKKEVTIMSDNEEKIKDYILNTLKRGLTVYDAVGGYTGTPKKTLVTVLGRSEFSKLKIALKELDPKCFLIVRTVHEVMGEGFEQL